MKRDFQNTVKSNMKKCFLVYIIIIIIIIVFRGIHGEDVLFIMKIYFKMTTLRRLTKKQLSLLTIYIFSFFRSFLIILP